MGVDSFGGRKPGSPRARNEISNTCGGSVSDIATNALPYTGISRVRFEGCVLSRLAPLATNEYRPYQRPRTKSKGF